MGVVSYADDLGHCSDVQSMPTAVDVLAFYEDKMRLVVITRSLFLSQLQVSRCCVEWIMCVCGAGIGWCRCSLHGRPYVDTPSRVYIPYGGAECLSGRAV
jgi:hypothetical protein